MGPSRRPYTELSLCKDENGFVKTLVQKKGNIKYSSIESARKANIQYSSIESTGKNTVCESKVQKQEETTNMV